MTPQSVWALTCVYVAAADGFLDEAVQERELFHVDGSGAALCRVLGDFLSQGLLVLAVQAEVLQDICRRLDVLVVICHGGP